MELKPGYKQTELGVIPQEWDVDRLERFWSVIDCKHVTAKFVANGYPVASIMEVQSRFVDLRNANFTTATFYNALIEGGRRPRAGDLILSRNATVGEIAQVAEWHPPFAMGQDVCLLRKRSSGLSTNYLQLLFGFQFIREQFSDLMVGSTFKRVNVKQVRDLIVPMPSPREQHAIAEVLSDANTLIETVEQHLAKKRQIKQGVMQELLTGKRQLPRWRSKRIVLRLGDVAHIKTGTRNNQDKVSDGEYPFFVRSANVERINSFSYDCEAILVPGEGGIGGIFHYVHGRFDAHQRVYAITQFAPEVSARFVYYYMAHTFGVHAMKNSVKATVDSLRLPTFQKFELRVPSSLDEQFEVVAVLADMDDELTILEKQLVKAYDMRAGMMQNLLTGRIRLVDAKAANDLQLVQST